MKSYLALCILFLSIASGAIAADKAQHFKEERLVEKYAGDIVAVRLQLDNVTIQKGVKVKTGTAMLTIPSKVVEIGLGNNVSVFRYSDAPKIVISTENIETFQMTSSDLNIYQILDYMFTKTSKDNSSEVKYPSDLWNELMLIKKGFFKNGSKAYLYDNTPLKIYYIAKAGEPFTNIAWAVNIDKPNLALRIESNMDSNTFRKILLSIKLKEK